MFDCFFLGIDGGLGSIDFLYGGLVIIFSLLYGRLGSRYIGLVSLNGSFGCLDCFLGCFGVGFGIF